MLSHLPKMIRGPYHQEADKFNLEMSSKVLLPSSDARRVIRRDSTVHNYSENVREVTFFMIASEESEGDSTEVGRIQLKAGETVAMPEWVVKSGWVLRAKADANSAVNLLLSYDEESTK